MDANKREVVVLKHCDVLLSAGNLDNQRSHLGKAADGSAHLSFFFSIRNILCSSMMTIHKGKGNDWGVCVTPTSGTRWTPVRESGSRRNGSDERKRRAYTAIAATHHPVVEQLLLLWCFFSGIVRACPHTRERARRERGHFRSLTKENTNEGSFLLE